MKEMVMEKKGKKMVIVERNDKLKGKGKIRMKVEEWEVWRKDLNVVDGEIERKKMKMVKGNEIVGVIDEVGKGVDK